MTFLRSVKQVRFWMFFVLIAYVAQAVGVSAHGKVTMMVSSVINEAQVSKAGSEPRHMAHCHNEKVESVSVVTFDQRRAAQESESCCGDDCSMSVCHPTSVTLGYFVLFPYIFDNSVIYFSHQSDARQLASTLYRPPILG
ncbi:hypothetical protein [Saccharophagus degradans]|nr:hypothetical protein [Saccharophagus degradans]